MMIGTDSHTQMRRLGMLATASEELMPSTVMAGRGWKLKFRDPSA